ncbi:MAG: YbhB/YbcL family Raf kinase inhibitor-like protein [Bacteroidia bacterium]|jgi:Raf kinase inhibitor-like YbhB/YbcL family protein|nr:YbhB/YbcL family Raf kinase inhibitor-like protein [Bacteroidia bacterium]GIV23807.1 MAG: UPF0098 protein [Bacteroidia bacterium]
MRYILSLSAALWAQMWVRIQGYEPGAFLPPEHTCDGADIALTIQWGGAPAGTQVYVLRLYDPDAPADTFTHWIVYNFSGQEVGPRAQHLKEGYNDFGQKGYRGPCPPPRDAAHRYVAEVYALRRPLQVSEPVTWDKLRPALADKVLARAETFVRYKRQKH